MAFTLTLLGTDTQFSPESVANAYDKAETLSYISTLINPDLDGAASPNSEQVTLASVTSPVVSYKKKDVVVINGPTTLGQEIGDRISLGVLAILEALSRGETNINVIAHSRGAVEAILVAHELERIQTHLSKSEDRTKLSNSVCAYTKHAMTQTHKDAYACLNWDAVRTNVESAKLSIFNIDPVPGGSIYGTRYLSSLPWVDPRFYELPKIVREYEQYIYENERTRCFKPVVPKCASQETKFKLGSLLGHHGTGSGNLLDQQRGVNPVKDKSTEHVQQLVVVKLIDFLTRNGVTLHARTSNDPFAPLIETLFKSRRASHLIERKHYDAIYCHLYSEIFKNKEAYLHYNKTSYAYLGQEQLVRRLLLWGWGLVEQRMVHHQAHNDTFLMSILPPPPTTKYLNTEHARYSINKDLGVNSDMPLSVVINTVVSKLLKTCRVRSERNSPTDGVTPRLQATDSVTRMVETTASDTGIDILLEPVGLLLTEVRTAYLHKKVTDQTELNALRTEVKEAFAQFESFLGKNADDPLAIRVLSEFRNSLNKTVDDKCSELEQRCVTLSTKLQTNPTLSILSNEISKVIEDLSKATDLSTITLNVALKELLSQVNELQHHNPSADTIKDFLNAVYENMKQKEISDELAKNTHSWICILIADAAENNNNYLLESVIADLITTNNELEEFRNTLPGFKDLDSSLNCERLDGKLKSDNNALLDLMARHLAKQKNELSSFERLFGEQHVALYKQIEEKIISYRASINLTNLFVPTMAAHSERLDAISSHADDQDTQIAQLSKMLEEQKKQVVGLSRNAEEQESKMVNLRATLGEQERLVAGFMQKSVDHETQVASLSEQLKEQERLAADFKQKSVDHETQVASLSKQLNAQETLVARFMQKSAEHERQVLSLSEQLKEQERLAADFKQKSVDHETQVASLSKQLNAQETLVAGFMQKSAEHERQVVSLNEQLKEQERLAADFKQKSVDHETQLASLSKQLNAQETLVAGFHQKSAAHETQVTRLSKQLEVQDSVITTLNTTAEEYKTQVASLSGGLKDQERLVAGLNKKSEHYETQVSSLTMLLKDQERLIADLTKKSEAYDTQVVDLHKELKEQKKLVAGFNKKTEDYEKQVTKLGDQLKEQKRRFAKLEQKAQKQTEQITLLVKKSEEQTDLLEQQNATTAEHTKTIQQLLALGTNLANDNDTLRQHMTDLTGQVKDLQDQAQLKDDFDFDAEMKWHMIIRDKLKPLTNGYLLYLAREIKKTVAKDLDIKNVSQLVANVKAINHWPADQAAQHLKQKFEEVSKLADILNSNTKPSARGFKFYQQLTESDKAIQNHRDPAWMRYTANTLIIISIIVTGIIPGLVVLAATALAGKSPKFWNSAGTTFFDNCSDGVSKTLSEKPVIKPSFE